MSNSKFVVAIVAGVSLLGLTACNRVNADSKPVDTFPLPGGSCRSDIVQTEIYEYTAGGNAPYEEFRITGTPPLRLRFPQYYYTMEPNHRGGAQLSIDLSLLYPSAEPAAPTYDCAGRKYRSKSARTVNVSIRSNMMIGAIKSPSDRLTGNSLKQRYSKQFGNPGAIGGFLFFPFKNASWSNWEKGYRASGGRDPLYLADYKAVPSNGAATHIRFVECGQPDPLCELTVFYKNVPVILFFPKAAIPDAERYAGKVLSIIARADPDRDRNTGNAPPAKTPNPSEITIAPLTQKR